MTEWLFGWLDPFLDPGFILLAIPAWAVFGWSVRRRRAALPTASVALLSGLPRTLRARAWWLPSALVAAGITALAVALARPHTREPLPIQSEGVDILLLIDVSGSMAARDVTATGDARRVDAAREQALAFAAARTNDRVGLMTFALFPDLRCPLTLDKDALAAFLRAVEPVPEGSPENKTAIGVALTAAAKDLEDSDAKTKLVVLLTDGENNVANVTPEDAAKYAKDASVKVHTIGLGSGSRGVFGMVIEPDFSTIEMIAEKTGGRFFRARTADDLREVYAEIDREERSELEDPRYRTSDWYELPLAIGAALLGLALLIQFTWIRGVP